MEATIRIGHARELTVRAGGSNVQNLTPLNWLNEETTDNFCTVYPIHTIFTDPTNGRRHIVRTNDGTFVRDLIDDQSEIELDHNHVLVSDEVINMETLETCTHEEWVARQMPPSTQVVVSYHAGSDVTLAVSNYYGSISDLPYLELANQHGFVFYHVVGDFLVVIVDLDDPAVITPIARGNLALELKEVIGNIYIYQIRGASLHTKAAVRRPLE